MDESRRLLGRDLWEEHTKAEPLKPPWLRLETLHRHLRQLRTSQKRRRHQTPSPQGRGEETFPQQQETQQGAKEQRDGWKVRGAGRSEGKICRCEGAPVSRPSSAALQSHPSLPQHQAQLSRSLESADEAIGQLVLLPATLPLRQAELGFATSCKPLSRS